MFFIVIITCFLIFFPVYSFESDADDSIIVERNLFSPDREKWVMPDKKVQKQKKEDVEDIVLSGTIVSEGICSAILSLNTKPKRRRSGGRNPGKSRLYMEGDYIGGYLVSQVQESFVVLSDEKSLEDFKIFLYDSKKDRTLVKTEIKEGANRTSKVGNSKKRKNRKLIERVEKSIKNLNRSYSRSVIKRADKDLGRITKNYSSLSREEKNNFRKMKKELELLKKKYKNK